MTWKPLLIQAPDAAVGLERLSLDSPPLREGQLQELIRLHPNLLPIQELEPGCDEITCIGREVQTGSGPLDHLLISPNGLLTLVETKLWKNPEARREVVGQIIDYTKQIARWDFAKLEQCAKAYLAKNHQWTGDLYGWLEEQFSEMPEESDFVDHVSRNLQQGRFLLLVVGDGIRESVQAMVEYLQSTPTLLFKLALVEIRFFKVGDGDWPLMAIPRVVAKTKEVERAVVRIELADHAKELLQVSSVAPAVIGAEVPTANRQTKPALSEGIFLEQLESVIGKEAVGKLRSFLNRLSDLPTIQPICNQRLALKWTPESADGRLWLKLLQFGPKGFVWTESNQTLDERVFSEIDSSIVRQYWTRLGRIHPKLEPSLQSTGKWQKEWVRIVEIADRFDDIEAAIREFVAAAEKLLDQK